MKKIILTLTILCLMFISCNSIKTSNAKTALLEGTWELNYITEPRIAFGELFPNKKPTIIFDLKENRISGNAICNRYSGILNVEGNEINFKEPIAMTKMMCLDINGEVVFMAALQKIDSYSISKDGKTLNFITADTAMMRFDKK